MLERTNNNFPNFNIIEMLTKYIYNVSYITSKKKEKWNCSKDHSWKLNLSNGNGKFCQFENSESLCLLSMRHSNVRPPYFHY